jgi:hypothetical protein
MIERGIVSQRGGVLMNRRLDREDRRRAWWMLLFLIPFVALMWLPFYAHATPTLWGLPFFYWYQFLWVLLTVVITAFVYWMVG